LCGGHVSWPSKTAVVDSSVLQSSPHQADPKLAPRRVKDFDFDFLFAPNVGIKKG